MIDLKTATEQSRNPQRVDDRFYRVLRFRFLDGIEKPEITRIARALIGADGALWNPKAVVAYYSGARMAAVIKLNEKETADFKLYLASILRDHLLDVKAENRFAVSFTAGTFEFRPSLDPEGSFNAHLADEPLGTKPFIRLTQQDLKELSQLKMENPAKLQASLVQGVITAIKLEDQNILNALPLDDMIGKEALHVALPLSAFSNIPKDELESQIKFQIMRLAKHHKTLYGRNVTFILYSANQELLEIAHNESKPYSSFIQVTDAPPQEGVVFVEVEEINNLPNLSDSQISLPTGKIDPKSLGNFFALGAFGIYAGRTLSKDGKINLKDLNLENVSNTAVSGYNALSISPVDRAKYYQITSHKENARADILSLMRNHLLRAFVPVPVDMDIQLVLAKLMKMAEQSA